MKVKLAVLTVSSYTSLGSINAEHWYGKIHCIDESERKSLELKRKLTDQKEVDHLNEKDDTREASAWTTQVQRPAGCCDNTRCTTSA